MQVNNVNSQNFTGVKYQYHNVTNAWFNYKLKQGGKSAVAKMAKIMEAQKDNPYHIVLNYTGDNKSVKEYTTVNGKEFVKGKFEPIINLIKRSAKYANNLKRNAVEPPIELAGLEDFIIDEL